MTNRTGRCLCGAVSFTAKGAHDSFDVCHCEMCRRWAAGPMLAIESDSVDFEGEENIGIFTSSDWAERGFCKKCGTSLFYRLTIGSGETHVSAGALDDLAGMDLSKEIFIDRKPEGYAFAGDRPRLTEAEVFAAAGQSETGDH
ncbi:GFA family protein [Qingshengfaniella alkalisoli]|uniref:GFA family protein n=1 Tax=Qingshengfaniella alkalisoli TaxID=2599296 RepID=A0A5B8I9Z8_9RHOB|nr:GFA family protein [Qingshengfaniella alkalisoli]QDY69956.1 GFA family protein [Qingshengfaniella alkalisoli]